MEPEAEGPYGVLGDCILLSPGWGLDTSVMGQGIGGGLVGAHKSSLGLGLALVCRW